MVILVMPLLAWRLQLTWSRPAREPSPSPEAPPVAGSAGGRRSGFALPAAPSTPGSTLWPELAFPGGQAESRACVPRGRPSARAGARAASARFPLPGGSGGRWTPVRAAQNRRPCLSGSSSRRGGGPTPGRSVQTTAIPVSLRPRGPPEPATMPLGLKPTCSVCKTTSSSMWKKSPQGDILCHHCTGRGGGGGGAGVAGGPGVAGGFGTATLASTSAGPPQSNGGGGGKQVRSGPLCPHCPVDWTVRDKLRKLHRSQYQQPLCHRPPSCGPRPVCLLNRYHYIINQLLGRLKWKH